MIEGDRLAVGMASTTTTYLYWRVDKAALGDSLEPLSAPGQALRYDVRLQRRSLGLQVAHTSPPSRGLRVTYIYSRHHAQKPDNVPSHV